LSRVNLLAVYQGTLGQDLHLNANTRENDNDRNHT
jgi:hypothetical protein